MKYKDMATACRFYPNPSSFLVQLMQTSNMINFMDFAWCVWIIINGGGGGGGGGRGGGGGEEGGGEGGEEGGGSFEQRLRLLFLVRLLGHQVTGGNTSQGQSLACPRVL